MKIKSESPDVKSFFYSVKNGKGEDIVIPVIDVRDGPSEREISDKMTLSNNYRNGSRYMKPSYSQGGNCYQNSFKKPNLTTTTTTDHV